MVNLFAVIDHFQFYIVLKIPKTHYKLRRFPFDYKTPIGYTIAISIVGMVAFSALIVTSCVVSLAIDCFIYVTAGTKDMIVMLEDVNKYAEFKNDRPRIFKQLCEFIEPHSELRQLSDCNLHFILRLSYSI